MQRLVAKMNRRVHRRLSRYAGEAAALPLVHALREKRYARAIQRHKSSLPELSGVPQKLVADLERGGLSQIPMEQLGIPGASQILSLGQQLVVKEMDHFRSQAKAGVQFLMMRAAQVIANPELYLFGLTPVILDIAEAYLGLPAAFDGVSIQYTEADGSEQTTRIWHRDREDRRMMKIIVYLNDVDADGGPFQFLPREYPEPRKYFLTTEERLALDAGDLGTPISCEAPAATTIFADTARFFHRGKPAVARDRAAMFFSYVAQRPQHPFFCERSGITRAEISRMVRGLTPRQQRAALWRNALPMPWCLIPSAPL